jgi:hypothetical protein
LPVVPHVEVERMARDRLACDPFLGSRLVQLYQRRIGAPGRLAPDEQTMLPE